MDTHIDYLVAGHPGPTRDSIVSALRKGGHDASSFDGRISKRVMRGQVNNLVLVVHRLNEQETDCDPRLVAQSVFLAVNTLDAPVWIVTIEGFEEEKGELERAWGVDIQRKKPILMRVDYVKSESTNWYEEVFGNLINEPVSDE
jgi:hypothetical protein